MIQAVALMMRTACGVEDEAGGVETAVNRVLEAGCSTEELMLAERVQVGTRQMGERIEKELERIQYE